MRFFIKSFLVIFVLFIELYAQNTDGNLQERIEKSVFSDSLFCIDSVIVNDSSKYVYSYDTNGNIISRLYYWWNINLGGWVYAKKETNKYNSNKQLIKKLVVCWDWNDSVWFNISQHIYEYDSLGNQTKHIRQDAKNQIWENALRETSIYNSEGKIIIYLNEFSHWDNHEWVKKYKEIYTYNSIGNLCSKHLEYWDNGWIKKGKKYSYTYDKKKNIKTELIELINDSNSVQVEFCKYTYNDKNYLLSKLIKKAPEKRDCLNCPIYYLPLENYEKHSFSYDRNGNLILQLSEDWKDSSWIRSFKNSFIYDSNNNRTSYLSEKWENNNWEKNILYKYEYNSNGNMIHFIGKRYCDNNWIRSGGLISFYDSFGNLLRFTASEIKVYYKRTTNIEELNLNILDYCLYQNYPNPFNPKTIIIYSLPKSSFVQLKVYDILGREITTLVDKEQTSGRYKVEFNADNLSSGIYFYRLQSDNFVDTKKMILLR